MFHKEENVAVVLILNISPSELFLVRKFYI